MSRGWTTADIAQVYRQRGETCPVETACGDGRHKFGVSDKSERTVDGIVFASKLEARRYQELAFMQKCGSISELELQPRYLLQDAFAESSGKRHRKAEYVADFRYKDAFGRTVVEDAKGMKTPLYRMKLKMFRLKYPAVDFREVE
jgi:hypothetical protein